MGVRVATQRQPRRLPTAAAGGVKSQMALTAIDGLENLRGHEGGRAVERYAHTWTT